MPRPRRPLTLRDVSEASGVSEMTVSRVLRSRGDVSEATRNRVLEAARKLGYVPNKIAGALASQRVNLVGVIIPSLSNMVFPEVLSGISEILFSTFARISSCSNINGRHARQINLHLSLAWMSPRKFAAIVKANKKYLLCKLFFTNFLTYVSISILSPPPPCRKLNHAPVIFS